MAIKTVVFDIGNVLMDFCWEKYLRSFGYSEDMFWKLANAAVLSPEWNEYDRGMDEEEVLKLFIKNDPSVEMELRTVFGNLSGIVEEYPTSIPWIKDLKAKGYQVLVLSNYSGKARYECAGEMKFLDYVDGGILSYQEGLIKPEPEIYQLLIERYSLIPEECVFLDDRAENVEAAAKIGFQTIHFTTRENALGELEKMGVR